MSHEITQRNGQHSMAFAGQTPWHGLGQQLSGTETGREVMIAADLDWSVEVEPLYRKMPDGTFREFSLGRAAVRSDDGKDLGAVGKRWTAYQNEWMFDCFQPMVDQGLMKWHTAGHMKDGQRVWCLCELNLDNSVIIPGDEVRKFAMLSNGHDGKLAVHFGFTPIRVVCANTEAMARDSQASRLIRVRHTSQVKTNVEDLRDIMNLANQEFEATCDVYRSLAAAQINSSDLEKYVNLVFKVKEGTNPSTRQKNINQRVMDLFEGGRGAEMTRGTWWGAYNAVTEYTNHERGNNVGSRMNSVWFGQNATLNQHALKTAVALAL